MPQTSPASGPVPDDPPAQAPERYVFVYGTLRRGGANDITRLLPPPRFVGHAQIEGAMHHLGAYPGLRLQAGGLVRGEVYAIGPALERVLDEIEMIRPEPTGDYAKREVELAVTLAPAEAAASPSRLRCIVYEISPSHAHGRPLIASGDWIADKDA